MRKPQHSKIFLIPTIFVLGIIVTSCDCWRFGSGVVVDRHTNKPLDSVFAKSYVHKIDTSSYRSTMSTDSTGQFSGSTGNTGFCQDLVIELSKNGYYTQTVTNPTKDTIRLQRK